VRNFQQFSSLRKRLRADNVTDFTDGATQLRENPVKPEKPANLVQE
jgi:hypothetical protein